MNKIEHRINLVIEFIRRRFSNSEVIDSFLYGNCYYFAVILTHRFSFLKIVYLPIKGHFCVTDEENNYFDISGKIDVSDDKPILFSELLKQDESLCKRLVRDCIS